MVRGEREQHPPKEPVGHSKCGTCGGDLAPGVIWCKTCELFQRDAGGADPPRTQRCRHCGLFVPLPATKCYQCSGVLARKWVPELSVAALGALTGLVASLTLLGTTLGGLFEKYLKTESHSTVSIVRIDPYLPEIVVATSNTGRKSAAILDFRLVVRISVGTEVVTTFSESFAVDGKHSGLPLEHSDYARTHVLTPAGKPKLWDLAGTLAALSPKPQEDDTNAIIIQQLQRKSSEQVPHCTLRYLIQESATSSGQPQDVVEGTESSQQWTDFNCKKFLQSAYWNS